MSINIDTHAFSFHFVQIRKMFLLTIDCRCFVPIFLQHFQVDGSIGKYPIHILNIVYEIFVIPHVSVALVFVTKILFCAITIFKPNYIHPSPYCRFGDGL